MKRHGELVRVVEAVDPIVLSARLVECCENRCCECDLCEIPACVCQCFGQELSMCQEGRRVLVTLGQFSIVRLERDSQLLIPVLEYCMPEKECTAGCGSDDPCQLFQSITFPVNEFFPPSTLAPRCDYEGARQQCSCRK